MKHLYRNLFKIGLFLLCAVTSAPLYGGSQPCDEISNDRGCCNTECEEAVCDLDSFCCDVAWDGICVDSAVEICSDVSCSSGCDGDTTPPTAVCQNITVDLEDDGQASIEPSDIDGGSTDNSGSVELSVDRSSFSCADIRPASRRRPSVVNVTLTATDACDNSSSCTARVTVRDVTAPDAQCKDITISLAQEGQWNILPSDIDNGSSDACSLKLTLSKKQFTCVDLGSQTVTLTAQDESNNSSSCTATVTVEEGNADCSYVLRRTDNSLAVYPNPTAGVFTVLMPEGMDAGNATLDVIDTYGRKVLTLTTLQQRQAVLLGQLPKGLYFVCVRNPATTDAAEKMYFQRVWLQY